MCPARYGYTRGWHRGVAALVDFLGQPLRRARPVPQPARSILLLRLERFGDLILTLPTLELLRRAHPHANIAWMVHPEYAEFLRQAAPGVEVLPFGARTLRGRRFDLAFEFHGHPRWIALARRHADWVSGHGIRGGGFLLDADSPDVGTAGLAAPAPPRLALAPAWEAAAAPFLRVLPKAFVLVHPGCGQPSKRWPAEHWRTLLARCLAHRLRVVLAGGPADRGLCSDLAAEFASVISLAGQLDWGTLAGVVARARVVVAPDTGVIHLARALDTPTVALFGPTDPSRWAAAAGARDRLLVHTLPCSHCDRGHCRRLAADSPISPCLRAISAAEAWRAVIHLLEITRAHRSPVSAGSSVSLLHSTHDPSYNSALIPAQRAAN